MFTYVYKSLTDTVNVPHQFISSEKYYSDPFILLLTKVCGKFSTLTDFTHTDPHSTGAHSSYAGQKETTNIILLQKLF